MLRPAVMLVACGLLPLTGRADGIVFIDPRFSTDGRDLQTGLRAGAESFHGRLRLQGIFDVEFWPLPRGTRVRVDTKEYFIREAWYAVGPGLGMAWPLTPRIEATAASGVGRAMGGSGNSDWAGWLDAGLRFPASDEMNWGVLYQYHPRETVRDHRIALQIRLKSI